MKRNKLIRTGESESKDQIGDFCTIFVTFFHIDEKKFCLTHKECFQVYKAAVNPSKICCWSTIAIVWNRHPQKKLIIRFRHVVKVFLLNNNLMTSNVCLLLRAGFRPRKCQLCKSPDNFGKPQVKQSLIILASDFFCSMMAKKHLWLNQTPNFVIPRFCCRTHNSVRISDFLKDHPSGFFYIMY